jgi:hypothetical protein
MSFFWGFVVGAITVLALTKWAFYSMDHDDGQRND